MNTIEQDIKKLELYYGKRSLYIKILRENENERFAYSNIKEVK